MQVLLDWTVRTVILREALLVLHEFYIYPDKQLAVYRLHPQSNYFDGCHVQIAIQPLSLFRMFLWEKLLLTTLLFLTVVSQNLTTEAPVINIQPTDNRVLVELYAESLCPYCQKFIDGPLRKALEAKQSRKELLQATLQKSSNVLQATQDSEFPVIPRAGQEGDATDHRDRLLTVRPTALRRSNRPPKQCLWTGRKIPSENAGFESDAARPPHLLHGVLDKDRDINNFPKNIALVKLLSKDSKKKDESFKDSSLNESNIAKHSAHEVDEEDNELVAVINESTKGT
ncbi:unnamed protein product [Sphagnum balticum]